MRNSRRLFLNLALCVGAMWAMKASAQTYNVNYNLTNGSQTASADVSIGGSTVDVYAGSFNLTWNVQKPAGMPNGPFPVYCVDLFHDISVPTSYSVTLDSTNSYTNSSSSNLTSWERVAWLYNTYANSGLDITQSGALQLAIWYALDGQANGTNVTQGSGSQFYVVGADSLTTGSAYTNMIADANAYLASSVGKVSSATVFAATNHGANNNINQDMIGPALTTPEGSSLKLLCAGLTACMFASRLKLKRRRA